MCTGKITGITNMPTETRIIRVVDVPKGATAEEAERLLNSVDAADFYLATIAPGDVTGTDCVAHRAFYKRRRRDE